MATWKEKGVVPDSEDEDDSLETQSIQSCRERENEVRNNAKRDNDYHDCNEKTREQEVRTDMGWAIDEDRLSIPNEIVQEQSSQNGPLEPVGSTPSDERHVKTPIWSPSPPRIFKDPRTLFNFEDDTESQGPANQFLPITQASHHVLNLPVEDDISRSYVCITSPTSSILSSLPGSQPSQNPPRRLHSSKHSGQPLQETLEATSEQTLVQRAEEPGHFNGRSLRHRNPIQLHPYIVEQEKYRRTLKARGMTPMRLAPTPVEHIKRPREEISSEPESQEPETEDSQPVDLDGDSAPPSLGRNPVLEDVGKSFSKDDDEFPALDEILQLEHIGNRLERKGKQVSYSTKLRRPQLFRIQTQTAKPSHRRANSGGIFDTPASPPKTSSPLGKEPLSSRGSASRALSISSASKAPTPSWLDEDEVGIQKPSNLLTPATSAVKPIADPIIIPSDTDEENLFAREVSVAPSSASSDESVEIRKISKKIRGVLPASHLRLDQHLKTAKRPSHAHRESRSASPGPQLLRRGVALPKTTRAAQDNFHSASNSIPFLSDDSEESEVENYQAGFITEDTENTESYDLFAQQRIGFAEEDDRIDAMLPSDNRHGRGPDNRPRKRRRVGSTTSLPNGGWSYTRQPKITEHLNRPKAMRPSKSKFPSRLKRSSQRPSDGLPGQRRARAPPKLSILDVMSDIQASKRSLPKFIKIAARTARSKKDYGRQSPSKKFVRLPSREDTFDAQSVLLQWKDGKIKPKDLGYLARSRVDASMNPLNQIVDNHQTRLRSPMAKINTEVLHPRLGQGNIGVPRKLVVSREVQSSMTNFVTSQRSLPQRPNKDVPIHASFSRKHQDEPRFIGAQSRPAQLESSEVEYSCRHPTSAFRTRKKALDALYRNTRKRRAPEANLQLSRFLGDNDTVLRSIEIESFPGVRTNTNDHIDSAKQILRVRKRPPQRMDVGAAVYRQPSEPLILELLQPSDTQSVAHGDRKLVGLGKFGTSYTTHFDIFPLQSGIYFHESTFIGAGHLSAILSSWDPASSSVLRPIKSYRLGAKLLRWGPWNEEVSSDLGACFDWILEQLDLKCSAAMSLSTHHEAASIAMFVVDYVQHHLSFTDMQGQRTFFSRMVEILSDSSSRLEGKAASADRTRSQCEIEIMSIWTVLVMQLLQISRNQAIESSTTFKLEDLLLRVARHCVKLLLQQGLEPIRKLYDDLQYLSFRERGITTEQYAAQAWVIIMRVLKAARIPKGTFWDVTNTNLLDTDKSVLTDARAMEKTWYTMFSLLPLCEFDDSGVVVPGQRQMTSFDNWALPQKLIKSVFKFYSSDSRQSPSFSDYCRALFGRCHFLMTEWGWWKCNGMIGTMFDFFASQSLAHLRNEEVYKSPPFLEQLNTEPSLAVEIEDRCFHIFLKIVALAIQHMRRADETKGTRNLIARLLPNHDRQYPKEEPLDTRDLASLRNHHDLLCTLHWAAPPDQRPPLSLIQGLVNADQSHNAACLINLRAWQQLSRFLLSSPTLGNSFQPFLMWQNTFFSKVLHQYIGEDSDTRRQASIIGKESVSESYLKETILKNKRSTMELLRSLVRGLSGAVSSARSSDAAMAAFNTDIINTALMSTELYLEPYYDFLIEDIINTIWVYMSKIQELHPNEVSRLQATTPTTEEDSQGSLNIDVDVDRQMMIHPLYKAVVPQFCKVASQIVERRLYLAREPQFIEKLLKTWVRMVSFVTEASCDMEQFLPGGNSAVFGNQRGTDRAIKFWPLCLRELLRYKTFEDLRNSGLNIGLEWVLALTVPISSSDYLNELSLAIFEKKHPFVKARSETKLWLCSAPASSDVNQSLIRDAIDSMRELSRTSFESVNGIFKVGNSTTKPDFSPVLKAIMDSMQRELEAMEPGSAIHQQYVRFCQRVAEDIRSRGSDILPLTDFFVKSSTCYWPEESDPKLFGASIVAYSFRLRDQPARTSAELSHFLYRGWRNDLLSSRLTYHVGYIAKGMKYWTFTKFVLSNFIPAALQVGFGVGFGWILLCTYLPPLAGRVSALLEKDDDEAAATLEHLSNILKIVVNGLMKQRIGTREEILGVHPLHRGVIAVTVQFWLALLPSITAYIGRHSDAGVRIKEVNGALYSFAQQIIRQFNGTYGSNWANETDQFEVIEGPHEKSIVELITDDINSNWRLNLPLDAAMQSASGWLSIGGYSASERQRVDVSLEQLWGISLWEILEIGRPHFETGNPCSILKHESTNFQYTPDLIF